MSLVADHRDLRWSIIIGLVIVVGMSVASWFFAPKGENQVYVPSPSPRGGFRRKQELRLTWDRLWRSSLILSFVSCYAMWAITLLAQLHPLIEPRRSDLRAAFLHE